MRRMFLVPHVKSKKGGRGKKWNVQPFPSPDERHSYAGEFTGISVEICNKCDILALYNNGFYGKGSQSRSIPHTLLKDPPEESIELEETLSLGLEEAFFLSYHLKVLTINDFENKEMKWQDFMGSALEVKADFMESLASYLYLKSKGWVVKSGLKFAGNYFYRKGPRFYHASFVVIITTASNCNQLESRRLKGLQRIAETSDKDVLILDVSKPVNFQMLKIEDIAQLSITETVIKRFNYTSFVQSQRNT